MITITPISSNELYVSWEDVKGDSFELLRSCSPNDEFEILTANLTTPFFIDNQVNLYDNGIRYYYKVKGFSGGVVVEETEATSKYYHSADPIANKVIYESKIVLRVMDNPPVYVLIKRRDGKSCPECWNPITKKVRFANCKSCNGTGRITGYYPPIPIRVSQNISQMVNNSNMLDGDNVSLTPIDAWTINKPLLSPGDVIVDIMDQRYSVEQVMPRTKSRFVIRQLIQLYPLPKGHPAYDTKVDFEVMPSE